MILRSTQNFVQDTFSSNVKSIQYPFGVVEYLNTYFPVRYSNITNNDYKFRSAIFDFKDGRTSQLTPMFYHFVENVIKKHIREFPGNWGFLAAPASNAQKNNVRYTNLVSWLKQKYKDLKLLNEYINYTGSKEPNHKSKNRKSSGLNEIYTINNSVKGLNIVIFDDVVTTGQTLRDLATKLKALGANKIYFCSLGVTYYEKGNRY